MNCVICAKAEPADPWHCCVGCRATKAKSSVPATKLETGDPGDAATSRGLDTATKER